MKAYSITYNPIRLNIDSTYECISQMIWGLGYFKKKISEEINKNELVAEKEAEQYADIHIEPDVYFSVYWSIENSLNAHLEKRVSDFENLFCNAMYIMSFSYFENSLRKILKDKTISYKNGWKINKLIEEVESLSKKQPTFDYNSLELIRNQLCHNNLGTPNEKHKAEMEIYINAHTKEFSWIDEILVINEIEYCKNTLNEFYKYLCDVCDALGYKHSEAYNN